MTKVRNVLVGPVLFVVLAGVASCGGGGGGDSPAAPQGQATVFRSASLSGAQEVPPVTTMATGRGAVAVNPTTLAITGGVTFTGLSGAPTGAHIHRADTSIVFGLDQAADNATATVPANTVLSAADYAQLLAGTLYFNVHTVANTNGEIRGAITGTTGVTVGLATPNGGQEVPPNASTAVGRGILVVDSTTREILIAYVTHNVIGANAAHIHAGIPGVIGGIRITLNLGTNVATAAQGAVMTAQDMADLAINYLYFNVHSPTYPDGEIRGQITVQ